MMDTDKNGIITYLGNNLFEIKLKKFDKKIIDEIKNSFFTSRYDKRDNSWVIYVLNFHETARLVELSQTYSLELISKSEISPESVENRMFIDLENLLIIIKNSIPYELQYSLKIPENLPDEEKTELRKIKSQIIDEENYYYDYSSNTLEIPITVKNKKLILVQPWIPRRDKEKIEEKMEEIEKEYRKSYATSSTKCNDENYSIRQLPSGDKLYPFQCIGVKIIHERMKKHGAVLLADPMGVGKTLQVLTWTIKTKNFPALIVSPSIMKYEWKKSIKRFFKISDNKILILKGTNPVLTLGINPEQVIKKFDFVILNYEILPYWIEYLKKIGFKTIIYDEAHYLKNRSAKRTKAARDITKKIKNKLLLTGTPIQNNPEELISLLEISDTLHYFANSVTAFKRRYLKMKFIKKGRAGYWKILGGRLLDELNTKLRATIMIRRNKESVLKQLPPKLIKELWIELSDKDYKEYKQYELNEYSTPEQIRKSFKELRPNKPLPNYLETPEELMDYISQNYPEIFLILYNKLWNKLGEIKIKYALEWIKNYFEDNPDSKLVVFAYHKSVQKKLFDEINKDEELKKSKPLKITAETKPEERNKIMEQFQNNPENRIIVLSLKAAKEGITLTAAPQTLFVELWWNPQDLSQAEDRIHRISQKSDRVIINYLIAADTIDERIWNILRKKKETFDKITA